MFFEPCSFNIFIIRAFLISLHISRERPFSSLSPPISDPHRLELFDDYYSPPMPDRLEHLQRLPPITFLKPYEILNLNSRSVLRPFLGIHDYSCDSSHFRERESPKIFIPVLESARHYVVDQQTDFDLVATLFKSGVLLMIVYY